MDMFRDEEIVERHGAVEYHYSRKYLWNIPLGPKVIQRSYDKNADGKIFYRRFEKGDLVESGHYQLECSEKQLNEERSIEQSVRLFGIKTGLWKDNRDFKEVERYYENGFVRMERVLEDGVLINAMKDEKDKYIDIINNGNGLEIHSISYPGKNKKAEECYLYGKLVEREVCYDDGRIVNDKYKADGSYKRTIINIYDESYKRIKRYNSQNRLKISMQQTPLGTWIGKNFEQNKYFYKNENYVLLAGSRKRVYKYYTSHLYASVQICEEQLKRINFHRPTICKLLSQKKDFASKMELARGIKMMEMSR